jgi:predicted Zn finger-like uncharacterized protein
MDPQSRAVRIICPSCDASYDVPTVAAGRIVQCARCGNRWTPVEPVSAPPPIAAPPPPLAQPSARERLPIAVAAGQDRPRDWIAIVAWVASLALLAVLSTAAVAYRGPVMHAWPPSQRFYAAIGLMS